VIDVPLWAALAASLFPCWFLSRFHHRDLLRWSRTTKREYLAGYRDGLEHALGLVLTSGEDPVLAIMARRDVVAKEHLKRMQEERVA